MNLVILSGRLVRDPEVRSSGEIAVAKYTLAVDRTKKDADAQADFINCTAFGKNADFVEKYLHKGTKIMVTGHWQTGSYTNKDGQKVYTNECAVEKTEFCESKNANGQNSAPSGIDYKPNFGNPADYQKPMASTPPQMPAEGFMNFPDGDDCDLPFGPVTR